jgi:hypothetical protein
MTFTVDDFYDTLETCFDAIQEQANSGGFFVKLGRRDYAKGKFLVLCSFGGKYKASTHDDCSPIIRQSETRLLDCPFRINIRKHKNGQYFPFIVNLEHNHPLNVDLASIPQARKPLQSVIDEVKSISSLSIPPRNIVSNIRETYPECLVSNKDIYNMRASFKTKMLEGLSPIEFLLLKLPENGFLVHHLNDVHGKISHLFFSSQECIQLAKTFPYIYFLDCTYKTNRFHLPLLHIIGMTSFNTTFTVCVCFIASEKEVDYMVAIE